MSTRVIAEEIAALAALAQVKVEEIQHFIVGRTGTGNIVFTVPDDHCAVVVAVEDFNSDEGLTKTATLSQGGAAVTEAHRGEWAMGGDVFYIFPPGQAQIALSVTPQGGMTYFARAIGYTLPQSAYSRLSRMATRNLS